MLRSLVVSSGLDARKRHTLRRDGDWPIAGETMIKGFRPFSYDLKRAIEHYAQLVAKTTDDDERVFANMSCVFFAASFIEAQLNEWIRPDLFLKTYPVLHLLVLHLT